jgi:hypothetical protein
VRNLIIILILFGFILPPVVFTPGEVAYGAELNGWYAYINVGVDEAYKRLTIGQNKQAKEGHDKLWESPVPKTFLSAGIVEPYFYHPEWKQDSPFFWRDIRPLGKLPRTWEFTVKTKKPNVEVELNWDLGRVRKDVGLYLKRKEDKEYIDLHKKKIYTYQSALRESKFLLKAEKISSP